MSPKHALLLVLSFALGGGSALGMSVSPGSSRSCHLVNGEKLPVAAEARTVCDVVETAILRAAPGVGYTIELRVLSPSSLAATIVTTDGRTIPEQRIVVHDRQLNRESIARFADSIASELARVG